MGVKRSRGRSARSALVATAAVAASLVVGPAFEAQAATLTVTADDEDSGAGLTLREAVSDANPGDTIRFDPSLFAETITLDSSLIIFKDLTIIGLGITALTVSSTDGPTFDISNNASVTISDLRVEGVGAAIDASSSGDLQVDRVVVLGGTVGIEFDGPGADLRLDGTFVDGHPQQGIKLGRADSVVMENSSSVTTAARASSKRPARSSRFASSTVTCRATARVASM